MIRRGFTLLELLTAVSIMAMLGVAASSGYHSLVRGMKERGAVAAASAVLRSARERAAVDWSPTVVFCYNRCMREAGGPSEVSAVVCGEMVAVRKAGRISAVRGKKLYDEFGDLDLCYDKSDDESVVAKGAGMRLFRFGGNGMSEMRYSIVSEIVLTEPQALWVETFSGVSTNLALACFYNLNRSRNEPSAWQAGHAYGVEFSELQLPAGFVFGKEIPTRVGEITTPKVIYFDPESETTKSIDIWVTRPGDSGKPELYRKAGEARADDTAV